MRAALHRCADTSRAGRPRWARPARARASSLLHRAAPGTPGGGGGEEHLRRRVVRIQPAVFGDHVVGIAGRRTAAPAAWPAAAPSSRREIGRDRCRGRRGFRRGCCRSPSGCRRLRRRVRTERMPRQGCAVQHRAEIQRACPRPARDRACALPRAARRPAGAQRVDFVGASRARRCTAARAASAARGPAAVTCCPLMVQARWNRPARGRHRHQRGDLGAAAGLAEHGDVAGVAAEFARRARAPTAAPATRSSWPTLPDCCERRVAELARGTDSRRR